MLYGGGVRMICIEIADTGARVRIEREVWITSNRNGPVITSHRIKAKGVGDGHQIWSFGELDGCPLAKIITLAEYLETRILPDDDPELSDREALEIILGGSL